MEENNPSLPPQHSKFHFDNMHWKDPVRCGPLLLYQIGDLGCEGGYTTGAHGQFCHEISYIVSGKGIFSTNGIEYVVRQGDVYLSRPGEVHDVVADRIDPVRYFYAAFSPSGGPGGDLGAMLGRLDAAGDPVVQDRHGLHAPFVSIFNELINQKEYSAAMIESCLMQLVILAFRDYCEGVQAEYAPRPDADRARQLVYDVVNYIDANLCGIGELSDICGKFGYSTSYLSHIFTRETGQSMQEYYDRKRFEAAARWLAGGAMSVTEIAEKLCYQSIHSFSRAFRRHFGVPPTKYQDEQRKLNTVDGWR